MTSTFALFARLVFIVAVFGAGCPVWADKARVEFGDTRPDEDVRQTISDALPEEKKPETVFEARRQAKRGAGAVLDALNSQGYFAAQIDTAVITQEEAPVPALRIDTGRRFALGETSLDIIGDTPATDETVASISVNLERGATALPETILDEEGRLLNAWLDAGYPDVEMLERRAVADRDTGTLDITYRISPGPKVRYSTVIIEGEDLRTRREYIDRLITFKPGEVYDSNDLSRLRSRLGQTRLFTASGVRLGPADSEANSEGVQTRPVILTLTERPRHSIALGASYGTSEGVGLTGQWQRRNFTNMGDTLTVIGELATLRRSIDVEWRMPDKPRYGRSRFHGVNLIDETTDAYDRRSISVRTGIDVVATPKFSYGLSADVALVEEEDAFGSRSLQIVGVNGSARYDASDDLIDPTRGYKVRGRVRPAAAFGDTSAQFVTIETNASAYLPLTDNGKYVLAGRGRLGTTIGSDIANLPINSRFFSGGGGSVRGYGFQELGPRAADGTPLGGRSVAEVSIEGRARIWNNIGVVAFVDGGTVTTAETPDFSDMQYGAGLGVRYYTPIGPIRADFAVPLDAGDDQDAFQIYISIGQAF